MSRTRDGKGEREGDKHQCECQPDTAEEIVASGGYGFDLLFAERLLKSLHFPHPCFYNVPEAPVASLHAIRIRVDYDSELTGLWHVWGRTLKPLEQASPDQI